MMPETNEKHPTAVGVAVGVGGCGRRRSLGPVTAAILAMAVVVGCSSAPPVHDVVLIYCKKPEQFSAARHETLFNESHTEFAKFRTGSAHATIPVPGAEIRTATLDALPDEMASIPADFAQDLQYDATAKILTWHGTMRPDDRDALLSISAEVGWRRAVRTLFEGAQEVELSSHDMGFDLRALPANTFPCDDELLRAIPEVFLELNFFRYGKTARHADHALQYFHSVPAVRECMILTVDGKTTFMAQPSRENFPNTAEGERQFAEHHLTFARCCRAFTMLSNDARPPTVRVNDDTNTFTTEQERLRAANQSTRDRADAIRERNTTGSSGNTPHR